MNDTDSSDSEYASTSAPRLPWINNIAIHHNDTASDRTATLAAVASARRQVIDRCQTAWTSHNVGAGMIIASAVAFTAPTVSTTSATPAANRHRPRCAASTVRPTIHPSPA